MQIEKVDHRQLDIATKLVTLQRRAYRVEADLIGTEAIPPLHETPEELSSIDETFLGAYEEGVLVGAVSWKVVGGAVDIHRLVVDPLRFRRSRRLHVRREGRRRHQSQSRFRPSKQGSSSSHFSPRGTWLTRSRFVRPRSDLVAISHRENPTRRLERVEESAREFFPFVEGEG